MPTIVDSLLVTLGLDPSGFRRGTDEAIRAQDELTEQTRRQNAALSEQERKNAAAQKARTQDIQAKAKATAESFAKIRNQAISMLAVFTAGKGISSFTSDTISSTAALDRLADNVGISIDKLAGFKLAAQNAGGSAEGMMNQVQKTAQMLADFQAGRANSDISGFFFQGGQADAFKDTTSLILAQADVLHTKLVTMGEQQALLAARDMGISTPEFNFLKQGSAAVRQQMEESARLTRVTDSQGEASKRLAANWNNLKAQFESTGREILFKLTPIIDKLFEKLGQFAEWLKTVDVKSWADKLVTVVGQVFDDLKKLTAWLASGELKGWLEEATKAAKLFFDEAGKVVEQLGGWKIVLEGLIALKIVSMVAPIMGLAGAFTALAAPLLIIAGIAAAGFAIDKLVPQNMKDMVESWIAKGAAFMGYDEAQEKTGIKKTFRDYLPQWGNEALAAFGDKKAAQAANSQKAIEFFKSQGWTEEQSAGIVANLIQESSLNASAVGDSGSAFGIAQWHKDRQNDFRKWAGHDIRESNLMEQLAFVDFELRRGKEQAAGMKIKETETREQAAAAASKYYERPLNAKGDEEAKRAAIARGLRQKPDSTLAQNPARQAINGRNEYNQTVNNTRSTTSQSVQAETNIGKIEIHTQATDANGIASTIAPAIERKTQVFQASSGMW